MQHGTPKKKKKKELNVELLLDFPGSTVDKNLPANAGDMGSIPGLRKFHTPLATKAHEPQLLKPMCLEPVLHNKRSHGNEKPVHHSKGDPPSTPTTENLCSDKDPAQTKNTKK